MGSLVESRVLVPLAQLVSILSGWRSWQGSRLLLFAGRSRRQEGNVAPASSRRPRSTGNGSHAARGNEPRSYARLVPGRPLASSSERPIFTSDRGGTRQIRESASINTGPSGSHSAATTVKRNHADNAARALGQIVASSSLGIAVQRQAIVGVARSSNTDVTDVTDVSMVTNVVREAGRDGLPIGHVVGCGCRPRCF